MSKTLRMLERIELCGSRVQERTRWYILSSRGTHTSTAARHLFPFQQSTCIMVCHGPTQDNRHFRGVEDSLLPVTSGSRGVQYSSRRQIRPGPRDGMMLRCHVVLPAGALLSGFIPIRDRSFVGARKVCAAVRSHRHILQPRRPIYHQAFDVSEHNLM